MCGPAGGVLIVADERVEDILVGVEGEGLDENGMADGRGYEVSVSREVVIGEGFGFRALMLGGTAGGRQCRRGRIRITMYIIKKSIQTPKSPKLNSPNH